MRVIRDVVYEDILGYRPLRADLYIPEDSHTPRPVVIWMHGGGWALGDPRHGADGHFGRWPKVLARLAARGFVVMSVQYRFSSEAKFPAQIQDAKAAVRWIRTNASEYGADPTQVYAWGGSAGGYLAALLGTSCGAAALEPRNSAAAPIPGMPHVKSDPRRSDCVQGVIDWYGPIDFARLDAQSGPHAPFKHDAPSSPESTLLGCALSICSRRLMRLANPLDFVSRRTPPFLIMHGTSDHAVPIAQSEELYARLRANGVPVRLLELPGADHEFRGLGQSERAQVLDEVIAWLRRPGGSGRQVMQ